MPRLLYLPLLLGPAAASAHQGAHLHPHGVDLPLVLLLTTVAAIAVAWLVLRGRP